MENIYSTKLVSRSTTFLVPLGILLILLGMASVILSSIDLSNSRSTVTTINSTGQVVQYTVPSSYSEQSIWPTLAKGIWCGLFFIGVGIFCLICHREKTLISMRIVAFLGFISIFLSLFLFLSSIIVFQRYIFEGRTNANQRTSMEQKEVVVNVLLFICGVLSFIISLILTIGSLISGNFCQNQGDEFDNFANVLHPPPPPAYSAPHY
ncbi:unnamed protein product [Adineta ricciae]|uniref:Uncharacterized protein n=1 Tax=Adineta ricciae TaxID=249248 RepID=A0A815JZV4_ADIRI|nr:unnamed protein product [Adineta ricciae]CAF1388998.1 unnamed protein product [Adineta ricciae]